MPFAIPFPPIVQNQPPSALKNAIDNVAASHEVGDSEIREHNLCAIERISTFCNRAGNIPYDIGVIADNFGIRHKLDHKISRRQISRPSRPIQCGSLRFIVATRYAGKSQQQYRKE